VTMRSLRLLWCCLILSGCTRGNLSTLPVADPLAALRSAASLGQRSKDAATFKTLYNFNGGEDGGGAASGPSDFGGVLYGTTSAGGGSGCKGQGCGTVYKFTMSGSETVLHRFTGGSDGMRPVARLAYANGAFYGPAYPI
jgi:uncharacterized repeat protein (TIGR03803 family)